MYDAIKKLKVRGAPAIDMAMLSVLLRELRGMA